MDRMEDKHQVRLGAVQETLFVADGVLVYRYLMPLADPALGKAMAITLFRASSLEVAG
jgi:hypothetical protein